MIRSATHLVAQLVGVALVHGPEGSNQNILLRVHRLYFQTHDVSNSGCHVHSLGCEQERFAGGGCGRGHPVSCCLGSDLQASTLVALFQSLAAVLNN